MQYALIVEDRANSPTVHRAARPAHLERRRALQDEERQRPAACPAIAAPDPVSGGFRGSLVVAKFASRVAAQRWAERGLDALAGISARLTVKPFCQVLPA